MKEFLESQPLWTFYAYFGVIVVAALCAGIGPRNIGDFIKYLFQKENGQSVLRGIVLYVLFPAVTVFASALLFYFYIVLSSPKADAAELELYLGLDTTFKTSPQCEEKSDENPWDDTITSNGGFYLWLWTYEAFNFYIPGRHHSCAFNQDSHEGFDSLGLGVAWKIIPGVEIMYSQDWLENGMNTGTYNVRAQVLGDDKVGLWIKYTQHDFDDRNDEYLNYKGFGAAVTYRF